MSSAEKTDCTAPMLRRTRSLPDWYCYCSMHDTAAGSSRCSSSSCPKTGTGTATFILLHIYTRHRQVALWGNSSRHKLGFQTHLWPHNYLSTWSEYVNALRLKTSANFIQGYKEVVRLEHDGRYVLNFWKLYHHKSSQKLAWPSSSRLLTMLLIFFFLSSPMSFIGPLTMEWGVTHLELHCETAALGFEDRVAGENVTSDSSCFSCRNTSGRIVITMSCSVELRGVLPPSIVKLFFGFLELSFTHSWREEVSVCRSVSEVLLRSAFFVLFFNASNDASSAFSPKMLFVLVDKNVITFYLPQLFGCVGVMGQCLLFDTLYKRSKRPLTLGVNFDTSQSNYHLCYFIITLLKYI